MSEPLPGFPRLYEVQNAPGMVVVARPKRRYWLYTLAFLATVYTTLAIGARLEFNFERGLPPYLSTLDVFPFLWVLKQPARLLMGIPFSATLMLILLAHEMGHYVACLRYRVYATLPFFIPAPTPIGTLGAFIRIKSPIPSRKALFDIGVAGPIAGFVVALPVLVAAIALSKPLAATAPDAQIAFSFPLIFDLVSRAMGKGIPLDALNLHPIGIAAWVGMFATALNLLPGGQLDGGHIVYSLWPQWHRTVSRISVVLLVLGVFFWIGWGIWAVLLMASGMRHPQLGGGFFSMFAGDPTRRWEDPYAPLSAGRYVLAFIAAVMLVLAFMPAPFIGGGLGW